MPILEVRALAPESPGEVPRVLERLCRSVADALHCELDGVWATWENIPPTYYVEGDRAAEKQPYDTHPPIVRVLILETWNPTLVRAMLEAAAATLADALKIEPGNVFLRVEEMALGTVHAGGKILE